MTEHDYLLAWSLYGAAALGCLLVWLRMTGWLWRWLREPLRVLVAVLLFSPTVVDAERELLAPAIAITALDLLLKDRQQRLARGGGPEYVRHAGHGRVPIVRPDPLAV